MNILLTEQIVKHIMSNLGIINSKYVNIDQSKSLMSNDFIINEKLSFKMDNGIINNNIWGCQLSIDNQELKILLGDVSQFKEINEYCVIIHLSNAPIYGLYLTLDMQDSQALIACSLDGLKWIQCDTYLQASFLAGMEQIKNNIFITKKCNKYDYEYKSMLSFIEFHSNIFEENYEREKD